MRGKESGIRNQVVTRRTRRIDKSRYKRSQPGSLRNLIGFMIAYARPGMTLLSLLVLVLAYNLLVSSQLFEMKRLVIAGAGDSLRTEVEQTVRRVVNGAKLLEIDLESLRQKVTSLRRVRTAWVYRLLPNEIRVEVEERRPLVVARKESGSLAWVDSEAVDLGEFTNFDAGITPPVAKGFSRGFAEGQRTPAEVSEDQERVAVFKQIERELGASSNLWSQIDQIDLTYAKDVNLTLARPQVTVHLGSRDFQNRFETALRVLDAIKRGDRELLRRFRVQEPDRLIENSSRINFVDAARSDRVVINFSSPPRPKPEPQQESQKREAPKKKVPDKKKK